MPRQPVLPEVEPAVEISSFDVAAVALARNEQCAALAREVGLCQARHVGGVTGTVLTAVIALDLNLTHVVDCDKQRL